MKAAGSASARQKRRCGEFQLEDHGPGIGRLNLVDQEIIAGAPARRSFGGEDDPVPAGGHIRSRQGRAVMELDVLADLEGVGLAVIGRLRHLGAEIADEIGGRGWVLRVDVDQHAVKRRHRMHRRIVGIAVTVEARRRVRRDHVRERSPVFRLLTGRSRQSA